MSGTKKEEEDLPNKTELPSIKKPTTVKKYPFQTTTRSNNAGIKKQETNENVFDKQNESKIDTHRSEESKIEVLTQVVNEPIKADQNLPLMVDVAFGQETENPSLRIDTPEIIDLKPQVQQATGILMESRIELDLIEVADRKEEKKKIQRKDLTEKEIDEICGDRDERGGRRAYTKTKTPGLDPRFQQQNQTMRCFVMYTDFYRCENILGEGEMACQWFKDVFTSICPLDWIRRWDEAREEGRLGWTKGRTQGKFPGNRYGV